MGYEYEKELAGFRKHIQMSLLNIGKSQRDLAAEVRITKKDGTQKTVTDQMMTNWLGGAVKLGTIKQPIMDALARLIKMK
jgi:hypothetical protein